MVLYDFMELMGNAGQGNNCSFCFVSMHPAWWKWTKLRVNRGQINENSASGFSWPHPGIMWWIVNLYVFFFILTLLGPSPNTFLWIVSGCAIAIVTLLIIVTTGCVYFTRKRISQSMVQAPPPAEQLQMSLFNQRFVQSRMYLPDQYYNGYF